MSSKKSTTEATTKATTFENHLDTLSLDQEKNRSNSLEVQNFIYTAITRYIEEEDEDSICLHNLKIHYIDEQKARYETNGWTIAKKQRLLNALITELEIKNKESGEITNPIQTSLYEKSTFTPLEKHQLLMRMNQEEDRIDSINKIQNKKIFELQKSVHEWDSQHNYKFDIIVEEFENDSPSRIVAGATDPDRSLALAWALKSYLGGSRNIIHYYELCSKIKGINKTKRKVTAFQKLMGE